MKAVQQRLDALAKPQGSLGRLETLAVQLAGIQGRSTPKAAPRSGSSDGRRSRSDG